MGKFPFFSVANISSRFMTNKKGICLNIKLLKIVTHRNAVGRQALDWVHVEWLTSIPISSYDKWLASERGPLTKETFQFSSPLCAQQEQSLPFPSGIVIDGGDVINQSGSTKRIEKIFCLSRHAEARLF